MSNFEFNPNEDFTPVDVNALDLTLASESSATFSLSTAQVTDDGTATFNLTPSGDGDGMTFNLTPVIQPQSSEEFTTVQDLDIGGYSREMGSHVMAFSPPIQVSSTGGLTPDFTGLLPPPPPSLPMVRGTAPRPLPHLARMLGSPGGHHTEGQFSPPRPLPPSYMETYEPLPPPAAVQSRTYSYHESPNHSRPSGVSPPSSSQLSLLLQSSPQQQQIPAHSPPQYMQPPPPYKSPTYITSGLSSPPILLSPRHFPSDNVLRIAPSVTLTKKPRCSASSPRGGQLSSPIQSTQLASPRTPQTSTSPRPLQTVMSPRTPQIPTSPRHNLMASSPRAPQAPISPRPTHIATSPRPPSIQTSPRPPHSSLSPQTSQMSSSPLHANTLPSPPAPMKSPRVSAPSPRSPPPPPPPPSHVGMSSINHKLPSYSLEELKDLPGVNLKKSTVDLNTYVAAVAKNMHPNFANVDSYAERCLACIVRKIRSNLPTLKALEDITLFSRGGMSDPGCILVPRMKDGRITIARPGGGAGGTKKIHPHLALVQIFKDPNVSNHNALVSTSSCSSPFQGEGEVVCISPLHYQVEGKRIKPQPTPKKKMIPFDQFDVNEHSREFLAQCGRKSEVFRSEKFNESLGSDCEFLSDGDDEIDWVEKWNSESVPQKCNGIQEFNEEEILKEIKLLCLRSTTDGTGEYIKASAKLIKEMKVREDLLMLLKGKYDLQSLKDIIKPKLLPIKPPSPKIVKRAYNKKVSTPKPTKKKNPGEAWVSDAQAQNVINRTNTVIRPVVQPVVMPIKTEEDETVIQSLLDDIKGSFESQFEMDLDPFGNSVGPAFSSQDFGMASAFNLGNFDEDSFGADASTAREMFTSSTTTSQPVGVASVSSDAMFSGADLVENPAPGPSWSSTDQEFSQSEYLSSDSISQDQFLKMFDDN